MSWLLFIAALSCIYALYYKVTEEHSFTDCGRVIKKETGVTTHKYRSSEVYYLVMDFDSVGVRTMEVTPNTYFTSPVNTRACFDLPHAKDTGDLLVEVMASIGVLISIGGFVLLVLYYVHWLREGD